MAHRRFFVAHHLLFVLALSTGLVMGCAETPEEVFRALAAAAESGDREGFLRRLSAPSETVARGVLAAAPDGAPLLAPNGLSAQVNVVAVTIDDDTARLEVEGHDGVVWPVPMVREGRRWKVCLHRLQQEWAQIRLRGN